MQSFCFCHCTVWLNFCTNPPMILNPRRKYNAKAKEMSLTQINHVLKTNEYSLKPNGYDGRYNGSIKGFDSNILPSNSPCEDQRSAATCLQSRGMVFRVFDGHAGSACAQAVSERLLLHSSGECWQTILQTALRNTFKRLDNDISLEAPVDFGVPFARFTPLTEWLSLDALLVWLTWTEIFMWPIWVTAEQCSGYKGMMGGSQLSRLPMTTTQQKVLSEHPASERKTVVKHDRLLGLLIPFRAFADMKFKWSGELLNRIYEARPELLIGNENAANELP
uniref:Si:ch211-15p9.2 n=1 Tax=Sinocyclocheilus grahami TaxID=75366 RepID=A0A672SVW5_SINGR